MPHYHVRIKRKKGRPSTLYLFDLKKNRLEEFLKQARKGAEVSIHQAGGFDWVETKYISEIRIAQTIRPSSRYGIGYMKGENVFEKGKNVTSEFIKKPLPKSEKKIVSPSTKPRQEILSKNVFIVHGRDAKPLKELKTMLKNLGLKPVVLHEQPSGSRTIVEKLEKYSNVGYAFAILTPDDAGEELGHIKYGLEQTWKSLFTMFEEMKILEEKRDDDSDANESKADVLTIAYWILVDGLLQRRARQNVILEFGFFMGLLGRDRACCLYKGDVELPSDMQGIVYIPFKDSVNEVRNRIIKELKEAGYKIES